LPRFFIEHVEIQLLHLGSGPRVPAQEFEAGFHGRVVVEALDSDMDTQLTPAVMLNEFIEHHFQRNSMQRVVDLFHIHASKLCKG